MCPNCENIIYTQSWDWKRCCQGKQGDTATKSEKVDFKKKEKIIVATVRGCIDNTYTILTKTLDSHTKISMAHSGESHMASRINNGVHRRKNQQFCHQVRQSRIKLAQVLPSQQSTMKVRHFLYKLYTNQRIVFFSKLDYYVPFCHSSSFSPLWSPLQWPLTTLPQRLKRLLKLLNL